MLEGEAHGHHAVAAVDALVGMAVGSRGGVLDAVPGVAAAGRRVEARGDGAVDGEGHGDHRVAAVGGAVSPGVGAGAVIVGAVPDVVAAGLGSKL